MSIRIPPENGSHVTFRTYNWGDMARRAWGAKLNVPEVVYTFSNGSKKKSTDATTSGIYRRG